MDSAGNEANDASRDLSISADGRFVAFSSHATNLIVGDTNGQWDIFAHDRQTGTTTRISLDSVGNEANDASRDPAISGDGRFIAFQSNATNLVAGDTNRRPDIFVHDRQTGTTTRVSVDSAGNQANDNSLYNPPSISADGRFVAFQSDATNLVVGDTNGRGDIFVHDRQTGTTTRISLDSAGNETNDASHGLSINADGRFIAFQSNATNLVAGDTNRRPDIFVHDRQTGATTRVSVDSAGNEAYSYGTSDGSSLPSISADGRFVAFHSSAYNLVVGDTNYELDIFVHDRQRGTTIRANVDSAGNQADGYSFGNIPSRSSISADGRFVAFTSDARNLVAGGMNGVWDIYVHQLSCDLDADCDGTPDTQDNCLYIPNGPTIPDAGGQSQRDTNGDGFGNLCDPDLNNDGLVTAMDYMILRSRLNTADPDADLNGDGLVTTADYQILRGRSHQAPGPSGLVP